MSISRRSLFGLLAVAPLAPLVGAVKPALTVNRDVAQRMANYWRSMSLSPTAPYMAGTSRA